MTRKTRPIRILHVVGGMNRGGLETWLMHVLRNIDREQYRMDFLVHGNTPLPYDAEIREMGSRIIPCPHPSRPWRYDRHFTRAVRAFGPYDIVHSHVHHFSGMVLRLARREGVLIRIAHSHNDTSPVDRRAGLPRRLYLRLMERWIARHATLGLACSPEAAVSLFGPRWGQDPTRRILYYGIDLTPFTIPADRAAVRRELGLPERSFVVGHVGRFFPQKNHEFLLEIGAELAQVEPDVRLLLVGDGAPPSYAGAGRRVGFGREGRLHRSSPRCCQAHDGRDGRVPVAFTSRGPPPCLDRGASRRPAVHRIAQSSPGTRT